MTRPGGVVAACVWDHAGGGGPLATFWQAVHELDPDAPGESDLPGTREGHLAELAEAAGLGEVEPGELTVTLRFASFADWWEPFTLGVGPAGDYVAEAGRGRARGARRRLRRRLPPGPVRGHRHGLVRAGPGLTPDRVGAVRAAGTSRAGRRGRGTRSGRPRARCRRS